MYLAFTVLRPDVILLFSPFPCAPPPGPDSPADPARDFLSLFVPPPGPGQQGPRFLEFFFDFPTPGSTILKLRSYKDDRWDSQATARWRGILFMGPTTPPMTSRQGRIRELSPAT